MARRVCVRSSINIDEFFEVEHIVKTGETIASTSYSRRPGGKGANCATAIAKASGIEGTVDFRGTINQQDQWLRETLSSYGVRAGPDSLVNAPETPTGRAIIQLSTSTADNSIILLPGSNFADYSLPTELGSTYSHMLVQNEIPIIQTCEALIQAKKDNLVTIFNPSPIPSKGHVDTLIPWEAIDWLLVNEDETVELAKALGHPDSSDALEQLGKSLPHATGIVMTKGSAGVEMLLATSEDGFIRLESPCGQALQPIINTTGAGDTFAGYLTALLLKLGKNLPGEEEMRSILLIASEAATACCEKNGAMEAMPTISEVKARFNQRGESMPMSK